MSWEASPWCMNYPLTVYETVTLCMAEVAMHTPLRSLPSLSLMGYILLTVHLIYMGAVVYVKIQI